MYAVGNQCPNCNTVCGTRGNAIRHIKEALAAGRCADKARDPRKHAHPQASAVEQLTCRKCGELVEGRNAILAHMRAHMQQSFRDKEGRERGAGGD